MSIDLKMELAKQEYVNAINEINQKYELPLSIIEVIINGICNEVHNMKIMQIQKEQEELSKEDEVEKNKSKKESEK